MFLINGYVRFLTRKTGMVLLRVKAREREELCRKWHINKYYVEKNIKTQD